MLKAALAAAPPLAAGEDGRGDHVVRGVRPNELIALSQLLEPRTLACHPLLPFDVHANGFTPAVARAVAANSASAPPPLAATLGKGGSVKTASCDIDGCGALGFGPPSGLLKRHLAELAVLPPFADSRRQPLPTLASSFLGQLKRHVAIAAAARASSIFATTVGEFAEPPVVHALLPSAQLRAKNARPQDLALAHGADLISCAPPTPAARAAVKLVYDAARKEGYRHLGQVVHVPASGHATLCVESCTADPTFSGAPQHPLLRLPSPNGSSIEPLTVCVFGWSPSDVARATREVCRAIAAQEDHGSAGCARWALWDATATGETRKLPGGACVTLSVLVHLLTSYPTAGTGPCFWLKTYNQKMRGAELPLENDLRVDAAAVGAKLAAALKANNSVLPLIYNLLAGSPEAVRLCFGAGVAVNTVLDDQLQSAYGGVRLTVDSKDAERRLCVGADGTTHYGGGFSVHTYPAFGLPPALAPCTAKRPLSRLPPLVPGATSTELITGEAYSRGCRYAPAAGYQKAGDLAGATAIDISGVPTMNLRTLDTAAQTAAIHASIFFTQFASTGALPRVDAMWDVHGFPSLADALGAAVKGSVGLFRRGLVTAPLADVTSFMASGVTSLFAAHSAALRAMGDTGLAPLDMLAVSGYLGTTAALLRSLASGKYAGRGALSPKVCLSLNLNQVNGLPPPPPCVSAILGCAPSVEAPFVPLEASATGILGAAAAHANEMGALLAASSEPFACASPDCGFLCPTANALHAHLREVGHQAPPTGPGGAYVKTPALNRTLVERALRGLTATQQVVVTAAVATGRSIVLGGPGGVGKTVVTRALVSALMTLFPDGVLWLTPTGIARLVAGPLAMTLNAALGIGRPADTDTVASLVAKAKANGARLLPLLKRVKLLVVDEAHRVGEREILVLQELLRWAKNSTLPFAGVQCILSGDAGQTLNFTDGKLHPSAKAELSGKSTWLMAATGTDLKPLYFELSEILRTASREFIEAQIALRGGQQWAPGNSAYDYLHKNCSPDHPRNKGLVRVLGGQWVPTLEAVNKGYTALYAKHKQARYAETCVLDEAREQGGDGFRVLHLYAIDGLHSTTKGKFSLHRPHEDAHDGGAPPSIRLYPGAMVAVTNPFRVRINPCGPIAAWVPGYSSVPKFLKLHRWVEESMPHRYARWFALNVNSWLQRGLPFLSLSTRVARPVTPKFVADEPPRARDPILLPLPPPFEWTRGVESHMVADLKRAPTIAAPSTAVTPAGQPPAGARRLPHLCRLPLPRFSLPRTSSRRPPSPPPLPLRAALPTPWMFLRGGRPAFRRAP
jgi:hypothetical protein